MARPLDPPAAPGVADAVSRFLAGRLPPEEWDHRAHLLVAHHLIGAEGGPDAALARMRPLIRAHNARVGARTARGYHETITRYYLGAVHHVAAPAEDLVADPALGPEAPLHHWSPRTLASPEAATTWVPTDRAPIPWSWPSPGERG